jgi:AraC family transcriptional regulator
MTNVPGRNRHLGGVPEIRRLVEGQEWSVNEYTCAAGPSDRPFEERHEQVTVAAVISGSFTYRVDTGGAILHPGAFLFGNFGSCYQCGHDHSTGDRCIAFHFAPEYFSEVTASVAGTSRFKFPTAMLPAVPKVLPWLARIEARVSTSDRLEIDEAVPRIMEAVIGAVLNSTPTRVQVSAREERQIGEVLRYIELHAGDAIDLAVLSRVATMSKYHFLRIFRRTVGMTPYQFVLSVRMRRAAVRLATSAMPVSMIALDTGFGDLSTFNRRFKVVFGMSPLAYRGCERAN